MLKYCYYFVLLLCVSKCVKSVCDASSCASCSGMSCSSCLPGFYLDSQSCHRCSDITQHCKSCSKNDINLICLTCDQGFFLLANGAGGFCISCNINHCIECVTNVLCITCEYGYYGSRCQFQCSFCSDSVCPSHNCISGCVSGFYSTSVNDNDGCLACKEGCKHCTDYDSCTQCENAYYNAGGVCIKCQSNCFSCSDSISCDLCVSGKWRDDCEIDCLGCIDKTCTTQFGSCDKGCIDGYIRDNNGHCEPAPVKTKCPVDFQCNIESFCSNEECVPCSINCDNGVCIISNGTCFDGCKPGWKGETCAAQCATSCETCKQYSTECTHCTNGYFGDECKYSCSNTCARNTNGSTICGKYGECTSGCVDGYNGTHCQTKMEITDTEEDTNPSTVNIGIPIGVSVTAFVTIIAVVVLYIVIRRRRRRPQMHTYENDNVITDIRQNQSASETARASTAIQLNNQNDYVNQTRHTVADTVNTAGMANPSTYESLSEQRGDEHVYKSIN